MLLARLSAAAATRSFAIGLTGILLGLHLGRGDVGAAMLGLVVAAGMAGLAAGTLAVSFFGELFGRRRVLILTTFLSAGGLAAIALLPASGWLAFPAFLGMVNGMGRDRGPAQTVEQGILADLAPPAVRTRWFSNYALVQDVAGALGALALSLPAALKLSLGIPEAQGTRWTFGLAAVVTLAPLWFYRGLVTPAATGPVQLTEIRTPRLSPESRRRVTGLASLFALDSLGGGFLAGSVLSFWFFRRFDLDGGVLGLVFFTARVLNAISYPAAAALARRFGLIRTMVFTHLPSSLVLMVLPFVPAAGVAIGLFLLREALVQMDVPTRQSYVAAVTGPGERTFALGVTGVVRNLGWAVGPGLAGVTMAALGLGAPLLIGAALKVVYDGSLFVSFRRLAPPEEPPRAL
ncbi:MAG TPA: MFS transporter, partial [Gemmatimonadales bacterium]|nr:MFS transporter [Gemmatimonadales bacterium]